MVLLRLSKFSYGLIRLQYYTGRLYILLEDLFHMHRKQDYDIQSAKRFIKSIVDTLFLDSTAVTDFLT